MGSLVGGLPGALKEGPAKGLPKAPKPVGKATLPRTPIGVRGQGRAPGRSSGGVRGQVSAPSTSQHSLFSLHILEEGASKAADVVKKGYEDAYGSRPATQRGAERGLQAPGAAIATPINAGKFAEGLGAAAKNAPGNTARTITGILPGLVATGKAAVHAVEGHPHELGQIAQGIAHVVEHPWSSFQKEPVTTALMAAGGEGTLGRLAGAGMRSGALGERATQAASLERAPLKIYGTNPSPDQIDAGLHDISIPRRYSPDVIRKGGQVAADAFKERLLGHDPNMATGEQANRYLYGGSLLAQHGFKRVQGLFKPGLVDEQAAKGEMLRRMYTRAAAHTMQQIKPRVGAEAVPLAVEGVLRRPETAIADLNKELGRLQTSAKELTGKELRLNKANQAQIQKLLGDEKFKANPSPAFQAAREYSDWSRPLEQNLVSLGQLEPNQLHARNIPYAIAHMGAKYNESPGKHPLVAEVSSAKRAVKAAEKAVQRAPADATAKERLLNTRAGYGKLAQDLQAMKETGFIKPNGDQWPRLERSDRPLPPHQIETHMARNLGDRQVGFLTHKEGITYGKALHSYTGARPATERRSRTGVAFGNGAYKRSWADLHLQAYKHANDIAGHESRDQMIRRFGIGRFREKGEAERAADNFAHTPEGDRITKSLGPVSVQLIGPDRVVARGNAETRAYGPILRDFNLAEHKAITEAHDAPKYTLVPDTVAKRISEHDKLNQTSPTGRAFQWYTNKWRSSALFTSPRWMLGSPQEHAIRLAMANINPTAIFGAGRAVDIGRGLIDHWHSVAADLSRTPEERYVAKTHVAAWAAGTHYGSMAMNAVRRTASDVLEPGMGRDLAEAFSETTPVSQMIAGWNKWKEFVGRGMSKVEQNSKAAALGKAALNEQQKFGKQWRALIARQDTAIHQYAENKLSPNEASKLGNDVMEMMGNWTQLTPAVRKAVQTWSPFGLWWLTSMKFVFRSLPRDHPMKTAALAAMEAGSGVNQQKKTLPYLEGGIGVHLPIVGNVTLTPEYYSPFGVGVEPNVTAAGMIAPQVSDPLQTLAGVNPLTHKEIVQSNHKAVPPGILAARALYSLLEGPIPGLRQGVQLAREGGKPNEGSLNPFAIKPGSGKGLPSTLIKIFSPVRMTAGAHQPKEGSRERPERPEQERPVRKRPLRERERPIRERG